MQAVIFDRYRSIEPEAVTRFLAEQGWNQLNTKPGVIALWGVEKGGRTYKLILPLDPNSPDYPNRMIQALEIIGQAESRRESELMESLLDKSVVASEANRELIDLRLLPNLEGNRKNEFPAKKLGSILYSLQNLIDSIGKAVGGSYSSSITGVIPKAITTRTMLSVIGTATGSFVVKLGGEVPAEQGSLLDELDGSLEQRALSSFLSLIEISHQGRNDELREILMRLQRRTVVTYRKFLEEVSSADSGLDVKLGSVRPGVGGRACLSSTEILGIIALLAQFEPQIPEVIKVDGTLKVFGETSGSSNFRIERLSDGEAFHGRISPSVLQKTIELTHNRRYRAIIEETESINPITNESAKNWKLVDIDYLESALASDAENEVENSAASGGGV
jgi:hypothetical protein